MAKEVFEIDLKLEGVQEATDQLEALSSSLWSDEKVESFLRGEEPFETRSIFDIAERGWVEKKLSDDGDPKKFLRVKGIATTSSIDDNGVEVVADALRSMPSDFESRDTMLSNHNPDFPIGRVVSSRFVAGRSGNPARVEVVADIDPLLPATNGTPIGDMIESGIVSKFSFAWSTFDGEVIFSKKEEEAEKEEDEDSDVAWRFHFGLDHAPKIKVYSLKAVELSVVSVPADADATFGSATFARSLARYMLGKAKVTKTESGLVVPERVLVKKAPRLLKKGC